MSKKRTFISFFSGIEGFRLGLEAAGWRCVHSVEIEGFCRDVQKARYGRPPESNDITKVLAKNLPDADVWVAGWPCQGLSVAGLRKGLADDRSGLFWEFVRLLEQKRPRGLLAENVPGLLTTCSCPLCSSSHCGTCKEKAGPLEVDPEEWTCDACGGSNLVGGVLPAHRGTDFFVVLSALQRVGYGVQTRILDAQYLGVPQRRRRIFFVGRLGAPCPPEVLFEPEGGEGHPAAGAEEGPLAPGQPAGGPGSAGGDARAEQRIARGDLARALGGVGGGQDYGANKGTLVRPKVARSVTASAGHHGHSSPRGDGSDNLVAGTLQSCGEGQGRKTPEVDQIVQASSDKAHTVSKGTGGGLGGRDGQDDYVLVEGDSAASTPDLPRLRAGCGRAGETSILRIDQTRSDPLVRKKGVTDSIATGTGHGGYANQAVVRHEPEVFEPRFARNGRGKPERGAPPLKAQNGRTGKGDGAPCVLKEGEAYGIANDALERSGEGKGGTASERSGLGITTDVSPALKSSHPHAVAAPSVAAPLTAGSNPNSNMAGRRREDDQNIVAHPAPTLRDTKQGQDAPVVQALNVEAGLAPHGSMNGSNVAPTVEATEGKRKTVITSADVSPCLDTTFNRTGRGRTEAERLVAAPKQVAPCVTPIFERPGGETEAKRLVQQPLFIHTADGNSNQRDVKRDGKADCLSKAQPGAVAFNAQAGGNQGDLNVSDKGTGALTSTQTPAVAYDVRGMAQGGQSHAVPTDTTGTVDTDGRNPSGNEAGTLVGPNPMSVRRLTPTECERLQGFPDGWTCTCGVRPDCPARRIPPWLDPKSFKLGGCGHSACGCTCADSPRYKSLGNAVATCAVFWIGRRLPVILKAQKR